MNRNKLCDLIVSDTIENSIDHAADDVEAGRAELIKAAEYQAKYRRKVAILLIIAVIIGTIVLGRYKYFLLWAAKNFVFSLNGFWFMFDSPKASCETMLELKSIDSLSN